MERRSEDGIGAEVMLRTVGWLQSKEISEC